MHGFGLLFYKASAVCPEWMYEGCCLGILRFRTLPPNPYIGKVVEVMVYSGCPKLSGPYEKRDPRREYDFDNLPN